MSGVLDNRLVGILHGCLRHHSPYNPNTPLGHTACRRRLDNLRHGAGKTPVNRPSGDRWPANYGL
jgi:hypothetical protein